MTTLLAIILVRQMQKVASCFLLSLKSRWEALRRISLSLERHFRKSAWFFFPQDEWDRQVKLLRSRINLYNREHNQFLREFYKGTAEIILDANNRMLIPKRLLDWAGILDGNVVLAGQDGKIEVWEKNKYENRSVNEDEFASLAEKILGGPMNNNEE